MAKRRTTVKLSKAEMLDKEVEHLSAKVEEAVNLLVKYRPRLIEARRRQQRWAKKLAAEQEAAKPPSPAVRAARRLGQRVKLGKMKVTETTDIPNSEIFGGNGTNQFGEKLEAAIKTELQDANNRLAQAWNDSLGPKNPLKAKGGEPSKEQVAAEKAKHMKAAGFHPAKRS